MGGSRVRIRAGARRSVPVQLNRAGEGLVRGKERVKVRARAKVSGSGAAKRKVTLRR
jgi:hypothetical protein